MQYAGGKPDGGKPDVFLIIQILKTLFYIFLFYCKQTDILILHINEILKADDIQNNFKGSSML